ncbi:MAG TPA: glycosyltransferase, partial [Longimicrobiaceae bacterium]
MICILHGYLLDGSGSNLWTRSIVEFLCRQGRTVHLMAQENHPERYPFISEARRYHPDGAVETFHTRDGGGDAGCCILHKPVLGDTLPVYVWDRYEEFPRVVPMVDLPDDEVEAYNARNVAALRRIVRENGITAVHANHAVLMSVVARRVSAETGVPFSIMPHGSALEYAVKRDERFLRLATGAFAAAARIFVIGDEMRSRVHGVFAALPGLDAKMRDLHLGV